MNSLSRRRVPRSHPGGAGRPGAGIRCPQPPTQAQARWMSTSSSSTWPRARKKRRRDRFAAIASKADLDALQASLRATFLRLLDGFPGKAGTPPPVAEDRDDRGRRLRHREARLRELPRLFRLGAALQAQDHRVAATGRPQPVRPFDERQGRGRLPDPAHQPGETGLCRPDVRPRRSGRAEPVLGCRDEVARGST